MSLDPDGLRLLCCAMINRALLDMRSRGEGGPVNIKKDTYQSYVKAVIWLGSSKAAIYFDYVNVIDQQTALEACDWLTYAMELRLDPRANLSDKELLLLDEGIEFLGKRRGLVRATRELVEISVNRF